MELQVPRVIGWDGLGCLSSGASVYYRCIPHLPQYCRYSGLAFWQQLGAVRLSPMRDWEGVLFFELTVVWSF